jgi:hypothetical protein
MVALALGTGVDADGRRPLQAPGLVAAPRLSGTGRIGEAVELDPGVWSGAPALAVEWRRDGAAIPGAAGLGYVPVAADDRTDLTARVTASNAAGSAAAETAALAVVRVAPAVIGALPDLALVQGDPGQVAAAAAFAGEALTYSVTGAGAAIDAAGRVTIPTGTPLSAEVRVTAANSGGSASVAFTVTVAVAAPVAVGTLPDVVYGQGSGTRTVAAAPAFSGAELGYAVTGPAGVSVDPASGVVSIPTAAPISATVTVRASNASGSATQSFRLTVRSMATSYDAAAKLADMSFVSQGAAPAWSFQAGGFARLVPAATSRTHGAWSKAGGDGRYRCLARWTAPNTADAGASPFVLGARIVKSGANFTGLYVEAFRPASGNKNLQIVQYTGAGVATTRLALARPNWAWNTWYWVELELDGAEVRARIYAEAAAVPAWQVAAAATATGPGAFGPGTVPLNGKSPTVDVRQLEYVPAD